MNVYIITADTFIDAVFTTPKDAKAYVLNVYKVTAVYQGADRWMARTPGGFVWIRRRPVRGGR